MKLAKNKYKLGTLITAILLGIMLGLFLSGIIGNFVLKFTDTKDLTNIFRIILIPLFSALSILFGLKAPKTLEYTSYAVGILLLFQWGWDWYVQDWNFIRTEIAISSIISLLVNMFTGKVRISGAKKTFRGQLGLK